MQLVISNNQLSLLHHA